MSVSIHWWINHWWIKRDHVLSTWLQDNSLNSEWTLNKILISRSPRSLGLGESYHFQLTTIVLRACSLLVDWDPYHSRRRGESTRSLDWLTFIKILIDERSKLFHFQSYDCRVYSLKHIIARKTKMKSRAMIDHLVRYDSTNVFRVWVSNKMRVIRTRDVLFDFYSFYDSCVFDIKHFLSTRMKNVIQILKMFETTFDDVLIEQNDDDSKELIFETSSKKIDELMIDLIDLQIDLKDNLILEENKIIIFEMTSNRDLAMNDQIHIVTEIHIASKTAQHSSIDSISDVQIRFESMNSQARFDSSNSNSSRTDDFVTMNTRSRTRKRTYATTLIIINQLDFYFATFSIDLQRSNIISVVLKLHRNDLSTKSRYWRQMLNHRFFQKFQSIAVKKMIELKKTRHLFIDRKTFESD